MTDDEGPDWKPRIINAETIVRDYTLPNGTVLIMHCHFGEYDMAHFDRMTRLYPTVRFTYDTDGNR